MFSLTGSATIADESGAAGGKVPFIRGLSHIALLTTKIVVVYVVRPSQLLKPGTLAI